MRPTIPTALFHEARFWIKDDVDHFDIILISLISHMKIKIKMNQNFNLYKLKF